MKYTKTDVVFKECPNETSLLFSISNCPHKCDGCHTPTLQLDVGRELTNDVFKKLLDMYYPYITNVIFFGGDQHKELIDLLNIIKDYGLKATLWTGSDEVSIEIMSKLHYLKTGKYDKTKHIEGMALTSNQKYINLVKNEIIELSK